jgi:hypothetical protein
MLRQRGKKLTFGVARMLVLQEDDRQMIPERRFVRIFFHQTAKHLKGALIQAALGIYPTQRVNDPRLIGKPSGHPFGQSQRPIEVRSGFSQIESQGVHRRCVVRIERQLPV